MPNPEHLQILRKGVQAWNRWRSDNPEVIPDLSSALVPKVITANGLTEVDLRAINFSGADLSGADLSGADLSGADLSGADLREARLGLDFRNGVDFTKVYLAKKTSEEVKQATADQGHDVQLKAIVDAAGFSAVSRVPPPKQGADLSKANLSRANLWKAYLWRVNLSGANLSGANLSEAKIWYTTLTEANLSGANLSGATLWGADLNKATLNAADLRMSIGTWFDQNEIRGALFSPYSRDMWSILRRSYTGPRLLFHLLLLIAFFIPYTLEAVHWLAINEGQHAIRNATIAAQTAASSVQNIPQSAEPGSANETARREAQRSARVQVGEALERIGRIKPCLADDCVALPMWKILLGVNRGWLFGVLSISLILYNAARVLLTWTVGALREEEERSGYTPALKGWTGYHWLYRVHQVAFVFLCINVCSLAWHLWDWLSRPVLLPKV